MVVINENRHLQKTGDAKRWDENTECLQFNKSTTKTQNQLNQQILAFRFEAVIARNKHLTDKLTELTASYPAATHASTLIVQ